MFLEDDDLKMLAIPPTLELPKDKLAAYLKVGQLNRTNVIMGEQLLYSIPYQS